MNHVLHTVPMSLVCLVCLVFAGCGSSGTLRQVDIQVVEPLEVRFAAMPAGRVYQAVSPLNDLNDDSDYAAYRGALRCARLDPAKSSLRIAQLSAVPPSPMLSFEVDIAPRGTPAHTDLAWTPLIRFAGAIAEGDATPFTDPGVVIEPAGVDRWERLALGGSPRVDVRFIGEVGSPIEALTVDITLQLDLSTVADGCPTPR